MSAFKIAVIPGDYIGPEVTREAVKVLKKVGEVFGHTFSFEEVLAGGAAIDACGIGLPEETLSVCRQSDAVLLGAVGGPKWDALEGEKRPEKALLALREGLGLYANLRPAMMHQALADACPLKKEIAGEGFSIMIVRELTGGIYFGERGVKNGKYGPASYDVESYSQFEIERIARMAFEIAGKRNKKVVSVDKANVLDTSRLWRKTVTEIAKEYPEISLSHMYVDNAAMQLVKDPKQFDVIVTSNLFGDILSDEASMLTGSIGLLPSASLKETGFGMYEPIHGSAPDIAGKNQANPIAAILSASMLLRYTLHLEKEADAVEQAVTEVLEKGYRTPDIQEIGTASIGTEEMGNLIKAAVSA